MKLSELRPCDSCGKPLTTGAGGVAIGFPYVVRVSMAFIDPQALRATVGTSMIVGSFGIGEVLSSDPEVLKIAGEHDESLWTELLICQDCALLGQLRIGELVDRRNSKAEGRS